MDKMPPLRGSLLARLAASYILIAVVFAGAWLWSLFGPLTDAALRQQERNLTAVAQSAALVTGGADIGADQLAQQLVARTDLRMTIVTTDGTVIADSNFDPDQMENHADRPEVAQALSGDVGVAKRLSRTEQREELYVAVPATLDGQRVALRVSQPVAEIEAIAERSRQLGLLLLGGALLAAIAIAVRTVRLASTPIGQLSATAEQMAAGDLSARLPVVPSDLQPLAGALEELRSQMRVRLEALDAERESLRAAIDGLRDGVLVLDGTTILLANRAVSDLFRTPAGGWRDTPLAAAGLPGALESVLLETLPGRETPAEFELEPDPTGRVLRVVIAPLEHHGHPDRAIVSVSDVTERARLDSVRRDFVANASHELKTPVSGIHLLAESVETAASDGDIETALVFAKQIESETGRLQRLVADLLDLSRLESVPAPGSIADARVAVGNAITSHRSAAQRKGLSLSVDFDDVRGADVFVAADTTDVTVALDNLLDNAIAYTTEGGVAVRVDASEQWVQLAVSDTGPGIAPEHQPRIFERFYRVDQGRSRDAGGTGLGLALVRHVVERNGGTVSLESNPGAGTTFTIALPRAH